MESEPVAAMPPHARSAVGNGTVLHKRGTTDGRSAEARRWRDLYRAFVGQLTDPTEHQRQLCRRAATLAMLAEGLEAKLAGGEGADPLTYARLCGHLNRVMAQLGLEAPDGEDVGAAMAELLK